MSANAQVPTVVRNVHYAEPETGDCLAAIVTEVIDDDHVALAAFDKDGENFQPGITEIGEPGQPGTWHWPERA